MPSDSVPVRMFTDEPDKLEHGIALCLSGGGYRAMIFHVGSLWRLNEAGILAKIKRISSVSGGSLASGALALAWSKLNFGTNGVARAFVENVVDPLRKLASRTLDEGAILSGVFGPGTVGEKVEAAYDRELFHGATLQDLPDEPRFIFNATSVQTGALWRFSKPYMADYRVGMIRNPEVTLAKAVAASSAFPPVLSPVRLDVNPGSFEANPSNDNLQSHPFDNHLVLTDGGVYDNLGLETAWKRYRTILVSDAGGKIKAEGEPKSDWIRHAMRVLDIVDNQVRSLRKRQLIDSYELRATEPESRWAREGTYWGIRTQIGDYGLPDALPCPDDQTLELAELATSLRAMPPRLQERLINWGYAVCDAALRKHVDEALIPGKFPYPGGVAP